MTICLVDVGSDKATVNLLLFLYLFTASASIIFFPNIKSISPFSKAKIRV